MVVQGYIIRTVLMLLLVFCLANGSQCSVGSTQTLIEESKAIQMSLGSNFNIGQIMYINSYFYGIMRFTLGVIDYSMLFKRDSDFLNGWSAAISMQTLDQTAGTTAIGDTFDISSTYTFLIFCGVIDPTNTHKAYISYIAESTGTISYSYLYSNLYILHSILLSGDDTTLFGIGRDSSNNGLICSLSMLSLSTGTCKNYNSFQTVSLYYLSTSNNGESIIFTFFDKSVSPYKFGIAKFISNSGVSGLAYDWVSQLNYYNSASVSTIRNAVLYSSCSSTSSTTDTIYNLALINSNILVLIQILKTTGLTSQTIYALDSSGGSTTYSFIDFTCSDNIVYILAASSTQSFIHTYDQNTLTIGTSYSVITFQTQSTDFFG